MVIVLDEVSPVRDWRHFFHFVSEVSISFNRVQVICMPSLSLRACCSVSFALGLLISGCGSSGPKPDIFETVSAAGTVTYKGQALEGYEVVFHQDGKRPAQGKTDASGKFVLGTNGPGDGAPAGKHKVTVVFVPVVPDSASATPDEIAKGASKPKVIIPKKYADREKTPLEVEIPAGGSSDLKLELVD